MIQIPFRSQDPYIKTGTILNLRQNSRLIHDPLCFQNPRIRSINRKNPQSLRFLRSYQSIRKSIHPPQSRFANCELLRLVMEIFNYKKVTVPANVLFECVIGHF